MNTVRLVIAMFVTVSSAILVNAADDQGQTYVHMVSVINDPLTKEFDGITNIVSASSTVQSLFPAAIYRYKDGKVNFACVGTVVFTDANTCNAIVPEHIFSADVGFSGAFVVRIARPDNHCIIGFINAIINPDTNSYLRDIAITTVSTNGMVIAPSLKRPMEEKVFTLPSPTVDISGTETKTIRSLITGEEVKIIGYGIRSNPKLEEELKAGKTVSVSEEHPYIIVEFKSDEGYSGTAFFDENNRIFILHGGFKDGNNDAGKDFLARYGREPKGMASLVGPVVFEPAN